MTEKSVSESIPSTAQDLLALVEQQATSSRLRQGRIEMDEDVFVVIRHGGGGFYYSVVSGVSRYPTYMTRQIALRCLEAFIRHEQEQAVYEASAVLA